MSMETKASIGMKQLSAPTESNGMRQLPVPTHKPSRKGPVSPKLQVKGPYKPGIKGPIKTKKYPKDTPEEEDIPDFDNNRQKKDWMREHGLSEQEFRRKQQKMKKHSGLISLSDVLREAAIKTKDLLSTNPDKAVKPVTWSTIPALIKRLLRRWRINSPSKIKQITHEVDNKDSDYSFRINKNIKEVDLSKTTRPQIGLIDPQKGLKWTSQGDVVNLTLPIEKDEFAKKDL